MPRHLFTAVACALMLVASALAESQDASSVAPPMSKQTRLLVIRSLNAEYVFARVPIPMGEKGLVIKGGAVQPEGQELDQALATYGIAVKPGERAQITNIEIKDRAILVEINGGPKKKKKWYQRIEVTGAGGTARAPDDQPIVSLGGVIQLIFDKHVPEMTGDQVRELLSPVMDFHAHSSQEAYLNTVPPQVKEAIKKHQVLVGMNREMVGYAKGRPWKKIREHDPDHGDYEEWLYGQPPQEVEFVRFVGDEVVQVEVMKVDGTKVMRKEKEVDIKPTGMVEAKSEGPKKPAVPPTLRRPGETRDTDINAPTGQPGPVLYPGNVPPLPTQPGLPPAP